MLARLPVAAFAAFIAANAAQHGSALIALVMGIGAVVVLFGLDESM